MQALLFLTYFDPSQGYVQEHSTQRIQITGLDNFTWGSTSGTAANMGFPGINGKNSTGGTYTSYTSNMNAWWGGGVPEYTVAWGGNMGFRNFFMTEQPGLATNAAGFYPFASAAKNFTYTPDKTSANGGGGTFYFSGGDITINVLLPSQTTPYPPSNWPAGLSNPANSAQPPIQTIKLTFPAATLPLPTMATAALNASNATPYVDRGSWNNRLQSGSGNASANAEFITAQDVVRSVRANPGDIRMIAGQAIVTDTASSPALGAGYFDNTAPASAVPSGTTRIQNVNPAWQYFSSTLNLVHSLRESLDFPFGGAIMGNLVPLPTTLYGGQPSPAGNGLSDHLHRWVDCLQQRREHRRIRRSVDV